MFILDWVEGCESQPFHLRLKLPYIINPHDLLVWRMQVSPVAG